MVFVRQASLSKEVDADIVMVHVLVNSIPEKQASSFFDQTVDEEL